MSELSFDSLDGNLCYGRGGVYIYEGMGVSGTGRKFFIPSMIAGTLAVIGCDSLLFYARISLDKDLSC